ncbi:signal peptidase complex subunit [Saccharomycopsis crataegensis]|uniref:Signal peptidase complex subunit 2 n=1 Tax=Saccharomycopsis crataegensis TaxID=43959 RepID=A0AAV5QJI5_9ASCO|nr:signal peptidase complex subunit [Saccharomycopsis crataegensis]
MDLNLFFIFESLGYVESFSLIDVRLALGIGCCAISGATFYLDKHSEFKESINLVAAAIVLYSILASVLWGWSKFVEKNIKFVGYKKSQKLIFKSSANKTDNLYSYEIKIGDNEPIIGSIEYNKVFNENGFLDFEEFKGYLTKEVEKIDKKKQ